MLFADEGNESSYTVSCAGAEGLLVIDRSVLRTEVFMRREGTGDLMRDGITVESVHMVGAAASPAHSLTVPSEPHRRMPRAYWRLETSAMMDWITSEANAAQAGVANAMGSNAAGLAIPAAKSAEAHPTVSPVDTVVWPPQAARASGRITTRRFIS
jgi:hypothetical protein